MRRSPPPATAWAPLRDAALPGAESSPRADGGGLKALADHAALRMMLYRRRSYVGGGDPERMAERERIAQGAAARLRRAKALSSPFLTSVTPTFVGHGAAGLARTPSSEGSGR